MAGVWTRNYFNALTALLLADDTLTSSAQPTDYTPPIMVRNKDGTWMAANSRPYRTNTNEALYNSEQYFELLWLGKEQADYGTYCYCGMGIQCGSSNAAATYEDYTLNAPIGSGLSLAPTTGTLDESTTITGDIVSSARSFVITNTSSSTINVGEIGVFVDCAYVRQEAILIYHESFDNVIALAPGESLIVTFKKQGQIYNYTPY